MSKAETQDEIVFRARLFEVKHIHKTLPDGKEKTYELIDIQNAITILPMDDQKNVYFVEQYRIGAGKQILELPAGKIEPGEDPLITARRELREEIGMDASEITPLGKFYVTPGYATETMFCYLATGLFPSPLKQDDDEFIHLHKISFADCMRMIAKREIEDAKTLAVFQLFTAKSQ